MSISNFKVFVTKNGDGAITYTQNDIDYKVYISKKDEVLMKVFHQYLSRLKSLKNRHYAIAEWIARDIRKNGYKFKAYSNNRKNIRPVKKAVK